MGLLRKLNDPSCYPTGNCLCTAEDEANKVPDVKGDRCKKGQVRTYPQDRVGGDGVGVLGAGGRGDHGSSTSASRAATQLNFLGVQRRYGRLR